jgi:uncharacterized iron-regulated membrane protein
MIRNPESASQSKWPDYAAVWRWHFYAGLFCLPFVCWLAITGSIYVFRPDIEAWLDRPYQNLTPVAERVAPSAEVEAALSAVKGSKFTRYEPPATAGGAAQIVVAKDDELVRVYIHPSTLRPLKIVRDDRRPMEIVEQLHGALLMGTFGSIMVELAASWAIVMIITGLFLWFPRSRNGFAGILYPRIGKKGRIYWRDLHAVTGMWISLIALFMLLSGLPWSVAWGNYLTWARNLSTVTAGTPDWPIGGKLAKPGAESTDPSGPSSMPGMTAAEMAAMGPPHDNGMNISDTDHQAMLLYELDVVVPAALKLDLPRPVWILPPAGHSGDWTASSQVQNRTRRVSYTISPADGRVTSKSGFSDQKIIDKAVNVGVAAHEGHLFGRINQAILIVTAVSLIGLTASAVVMWLRRKPKQALGAPRPVASPRFRGALVMAIAALAVIIPLFGLSLITVLLIERLVLRRLPATRQWLGLPSAAA